MKLNKVFQISKSLLQRYVHQNGTAYYKSVYFLTIDIILADLAPIAVFSEHMLINFKGEQFERFDYVHAV